MASTPFNLDPPIRHQRAIAGRCHEEGERARVGHAVGDRVTEQGELARAEPLGAQRESGGAHPLARSGQPGLLQVGEKVGRVGDRPRRGRRRSALCPRRARRVGKEQARDALAAEGAGAEGPGRDKQAEAEGQDHEDAGEDLLDRVPLRAGGPERGETPPRSPSLP